MDSDVNSRSAQKGQGHHDDGAGTDAWGPEARGQTLPNPPGSPRSPLSSLPELEFRPAALLYTSPTPLSLSTLPPSHCSLQNLSMIKLKAPWHFSSFPGSSAGQPFSPPLVLHFSHTGPLSVPRSRPCASLSRWHPTRSLSPGALLPPAMSSTVQFPGCQLGEALSTQCFN